MTTTDHVDGLRKRMDELVQQVARPDTAVDFMGLSAGPGGSLKGVASNYLSLHRLQVDRVIANAQKAESQGYDAFISGSIDDPGLRECRTLVDIPVIGYGQTAMHVASMLGTKVAVVAFAPDYFPLIAENIAAYGLANRFVGIVNLGIGYTDLTRALEDPSVFVGPLDAATREAKARGADIIIPGQAPINEVLFANGLSTSNGLPILNTRALAIKFAELAVDMHRTVGFSPARTGYFGMRPARELIEQAQATYGHVAPDPETP